MTKQSQCITGCGHEITSSAYSLCDGCWEMLKPNDNLEICGCGSELLTAAEQSMNACWLCKREELDEFNQDNPKGKKGKSLPFHLFKKATKGIIRQSGVQISDIACTHEGMPMVFKIGKGKVYASGLKNVKDWDWSKLNLIVSLSGHPTLLHKANGAAIEMMGDDFPALSPPLGLARLSMNWTDGEAPPFDLSYVEDLVALVATGTDTLIHCIGGHGRTGTMLVAMLCQMEDKPWGKKKVDPIKWIRTNYCKKAVETNVQIDWLKDRYDIVSKTKETSSNPYRSAGSWGNSYMGSF